MRIIGVVVLACLAGCSAIYDAQYNDRKSQLEQNRSVFLDDQTHIQFFAAGDDRIFWIDTPQALEATEMHSVDTKNGGSAVDYPWSKSISIDQGDGDGPNLALGDQLVVECEEATAFDAASSSESSSPYPSIESGADPCAVSGTSVYVVFGQDGSDSFIEQWNPSGGSNVSPFVDIGSISTNVNAIGFADATHFLYWESNNLWLIPTTGALPANPLNAQSQPVSAGTVAFDDKGVVFVTSVGETSGQPFYMSYDNPGVITAVADMIKNGGYSLNFEHSDVQNLLEDGAYTLFNRHLIYESSGGIFALGLDTGNVTDILLDGLEDSDDDVAPDYRNPQVTSTGKLFVQDEAFEATQHPVYEVDLNALLK